MSYKKHFILFIFFSIFLIKLSSQWNPNYSIGTTTGKTAFNYNTKPDNLIEIVSSGNTTATLDYQWESSLTAGFISYSAIGTASSYTFSVPLAQTTYYRRKVTIHGTSNFVYSNIVEINVVSLNWENINYIREHDVLKTGITTWTAIDQLVIGDKLQTTTYLDGLGRPVEKVSRETATPSAGTLWGDAVQFSQYDDKGRELKQYLPYTIQYATTTGTESGKYKAAPLTDQPQYYTNVYNETAPFSKITYEDNPLNRVKQVNAPGSSWKNSAGEQNSYDLNTGPENIRIWTIGYNTGDAPVTTDVYSLNLLYKTVGYNENGEQTIEYTNKAGQLILTKQQIADAPQTSHTGWICTYYVYDDFGLLRYVLQPQAVDYLSNNAWSFTGTAGQQVLNEWCFRYEYDAKGRCILKKAPGAAPLKMMYDSRDRIVFMQDGNQADKYTITYPGFSEWTVNLYDELDRVVASTLYKTNKSVATLQSDIDNAAATSTVTVTATGSSVALALSKSPLSSADLNNTGITTILKYQFYDTYSFPNVDPSDNTCTNTTAYPNSDPNVIAFAPTKRTLSLPTGSAVRVLGTTTMLTATNYYNERGQLLQTTEDNIKQGQDITTFQYHFDGRLLSTEENHSTANSGYTTFRILTKNVFDKIGRISSIQKKYYTNAFKTIASYDYDDMGRLKVKHLDPGYTGSGKNEMESLAYSYNIHNQITGINKDYALKNTGYDKWGNFFGLYLGYDDRDNIFSNALLDGHVSGTLWNTQGDDAQRRYVFSYDHATRLTNAAFTQRQAKADAWDNSKMDFTVTGSSGKITYDLNGNLLNMLQRGVMPGLSAPVDIDKMQYTYTNTTYTYTNKLFKVKDNTAQTATNGQSGDFKDGTNGTADDYVYDNNGNLTVDNNKAASSITYNFLDKPELITITGKGIIKIVYDAEGNKLQKIFTPQSGIAVTTTYINAFVYKDNAVQYINFEEGRLRVITPVSQGNGYDALTVDGSNALPNSKEGVYDFFIRDYQENVRMILTEEVHSGSNKCTMETARAGAEEPIFGQVDANGNVTSANEVVKTRFAVSGIPGQSTGNGWNNANIGSNVSKLNLTGNKVGPNVLLKVMAGDVINATTQYYYKANVTNTANNTSLPQDVLNSLVAALLNGGSTTSSVKGGSSGISNTLNVDPNFLSKTEPDAQDASGTKPKAYLTILFFDERFNYLTTGSQFRRTTGLRQDDNLSLTLANIQAPKNGYAYIYISNESDEPVYFDNLNVALNRGRIIEEDHYYAYGLKIAAISSQKLPDPNEGNIDNKNLYNDKELFDDADLDWYDYGFRNYDAQIGRFTQLDPLTWDYPELTNYQYASNDPILNIDLDGLEGFNAAFTGIGTAANQLPDVVVKGVAKKATSSALTSWVASNVGMLLTQTAKTVTSIKNIPNDISDSWQNIKTNVSNSWDETTQSASNWWERLKDNISNKAAREDKSVLQASVEVGLGYDSQNPSGLLGGIGGVGSVGRKMLLNETEQILKNETKQILKKELSNVGTDAIERHHAWAKYLGGAEKQDLVPLSKSLHNAYHTGLDKILPRWKGTAYYNSLTGEARTKMYKDLADYTKAFDSKYSTTLYDAMLKNGFPVK